jgi:tetratricopeptide (TPR) repeat protein
LEDAVLLDFVEGRASATAVLAIEEHLDRCPTCRKFLAETARGLSIETPVWSDEGLASPQQSASLRRGTAIERYVVLDQIGRGGMGIVYSAYDPELDRKLALKILRPDVSAQLGSDGARARVLREAQAMARLPHPNVIAVYDCGTVDGQVFVAMELSEGETLAAFLRARPRPWREVLDRFAQAGRGLSAAHGAGIVHRDFKPDNVLCGRDGRVRVTDFGLARVGYAAPLASAPAPPKGDAIAHLTRTGALMGTPAYMAPEQLAGRTPDARSDQFSFCVALYEALYGERPFAGDTIGELAEAIEHGSVREPPKKASVPAFLRRSLLRGLAARPEDRFPSMDALLSALGKDPAAARRRAAVAAVTMVSVAALSAGGYHLQHARSAVCSGATLKLGGIWDPPRKAAIKTAFLSTGLPYAEHTWASVERILDDYGRHYTAMHTEACEATRVRGEQSEEVLDLRMMCLSQRLSELKASSDLYTGADREVVKSAVDVALGLSSLEGCADVEALKAPMRPPKDANARAQIEEVRGELARATVFEQSGRFEDGLKVAEVALERAQSTAYKPLEAEAFLALGRLQMLARQDAPAEKSLEDAFYAAWASRHDEVATGAAAFLTRHVGENLARLPDGFRWARLSRAVLSRSPSNPRNEGMLASHVALLLLAQGKYAEALAEQRRALTVREKALGPSHPEVAASHSSIGFALARAGQHAEALGEHRRALEMREKVLGPTHPDVAESHSYMGNVLVKLGRYDEALAEHRLALTIRENALGQTHPLVSTSHNNIGIALGAQGKLEEALAEYRAALAISEKTLGPEHPSIAHRYSNIGIALGELGRYEEALTAFRRALAIQERGLGRDHPDMAMSYHNIGSVLRRQGRHAQAIGELRRALSIREKVLGADHPFVASTHGELGQTFLELHSFAEAIEHLRRALVLIEVAEPRPERLGEYRFALAEALWGASRDCAAALELAQKAHDDYAKTPKREKPIAEIDAWIAAHRCRTQ